MSALMTFLKRRPSGQIFTLLSASVGLFENPLAELVAVSMDCFVTPVMVLLVLWVLKGKITYGNSINLFYELWKRSEWESDTGTGTWTFNLFLGGRLQ